MTPENFTYWIQGFFEISDAKKLDETQVQIIKNHLALVFNKVTPDRNKSTLPSEMPKGSKFSGVDMTKVFCSTSTSSESNLGLTKVIC